jgi:hypothetical protein
MSQLHHTAETGGAIAAKTAAPVTVSLATVAGYPVSDLVLFATLIYTVLLVGHKLYAIYQDVTKKE